MPIMSQEGSLSWRRSMSMPNSPSLGRKKASSAENGGVAGGLLDSPSSRKSLKASRFMPTQLKGERTVKGLRLLRALTIPDTTSIKEACSRMAKRKVDALLLTDSNALLCGILTDKDIVIRVIAREVNMEDTPVSKVMTRNPVFVLADTLAVEALQKMVRGKFRHLPVVDNGEVIALLDITKCLYDAIARMERTDEKGKAIAAAVEGVEKQWGASMTGPSTLVETLRERMFRPSLSTIISDNSKIVTVDPGETVLAAAKKILELRASCAVVTVENKPRGILTSRDMLMGVIAQDLPAESTPVEKVMTPNPESARIDLPIVDALHTMHEGKFLHLPVVDKDGTIVSVVDVLHITHAAVTNAAVATVGSTPKINAEIANTIMQSFWDSAMAYSPDDQDETMSEDSLKPPSDGGETTRSIQPSYTNFSFKIQDGEGKMHRFICDTQNLTDLVAAILQRVGSEIDRNNIPQILYEDEEGDKVVLASDSDLQAAIHHARLIGQKGLRLHLDYSGGRGKNLEYAQTRASSYGAVVAGAALVASVGVYAFLRRAGN